MSSTMDGVFPFPPATGPGSDNDNGASAARSRDSLFLLAQLKLVGREEREVRVRNLSAGGMMAEYDGPVSIGDQLTVAVRGIGSVAGRVAWAAAGRIGIALDESIDPKKARKPVTTRGQP
ncbi:PilZ domain-containing protein [Sphingomonas aerophila]|jgi:hypothetical protein|nr:PilZ domain-containing protein [Sphingomonas aerophila]